MHSSISAVCNIGLYVARTGFVVYCRYINEMDNSLMLWLTIRVAAQRSGPGCKLAITERPIYLVLVLGFRV